MTSRGRAKAYLVGVALISFVVLLEFHEAQSEVGDDQETIVLLARRRLLLLRLCFNLLCDEQINVCGSGGFEFACRRRKIIDFSRCWVTRAHGGRHRKAIG